MIVHTWNSSRLRSNLLRPINSGVLTSLLLTHLSSFLTDYLPSLNLLCHSKTGAWLMQDGPNAVWSIPYISVAFFPSLKQNFIAYHSSKVSSRPDCIFEIHQLCQSGFSRVYSNCCCSCWFEPEIIKIGQSFHALFSKNIQNFQEPATILNACTKKVWKIIVCTSYIYLQKWITYFTKENLQFFQSSFLLFFFFFCIVWFYFIYFFFLGFMYISNSSTKDMIEGQFFSLNS